MFALSSPASRSALSSGSGSGRPAQDVHCAPKFCQGLGLRLPSTQHQGHPLLAGGPPAPSAAAAGPGAAHAAATRAHCLTPIPPSAQRVAVFRFSTLRPITVEITDTECRFHLFSHPPPAAWPHQTSVSQFHIIPVSSIDFMETFTTTVILVIIFNVLIVLCSSITESVLWILFRLLYLFSILASFCTQDNSALHRRAM